MYKLSSYSLSNTVEFLTNMPTFASLCGLAADSTITTALEESPRIRLESDNLDEDWLAAALAFYKHNKFDKHASLRITIHGQPGIDTGDVRRQFFSVVFAQLAKPSADSIFEAPQHRLRPAFKASSLSSGMLATVGTMIGHSILLHRWPRLSIPSGILLSLPYR